MGSFLGSIFGKAAGETIKATSDGLVGLATGIRSAITGDPTPDKIAEIQRMAMEFEQQSKNLQAEINKEEAKHESVFVSGWRPAIGWVCAIGLFYSIILRNILTIWFPGLPEVDLGYIQTLLVPMLGLGAFRTYEKKVGVNGNR